MAEEFIMTQEGYDEAKERLKYLQTEKIFGSFNDYFNNFFARFTFNI